MKTRRKLVKWIKILDVVKNFLLAFTALVALVGLGMFWYACRNVDVTYEFIDVSLLLFIVIPVALLFIGLILISIRFVLVRKRGTKRYFTIIYRKDKRDYLRRGQKI